MEPDATPHNPADETCPVDLLPVLDYNDLNSSSEKYYASCLSSEGGRWVTSSNGSKVEVLPSNVARLQLFGDEDPACTLLALHETGDESQVRALCLGGRWWSVADVLTSPSRSGLLMVRSVMERVVLFLLSQVLRVPGEEPVFTPHPIREPGKLFWRDGEAVGFYTFKNKGSLCDGCTSQSYMLPVLDTLLVRSTARRRGLALQMLEDFCSCFPDEEELGVSWPLSRGMMGVCSRYLSVHQQQRDRLYEVEAPGGWAQRRNIWLKIQLSNHSNGPGSEKGLSFRQQEQKRTLEEERGPLEEHRGPLEEHRGPLEEERRTLEELSPDARLATVGHTAPCDCSRGERRPNNDPNPDPKRPRTSDQPS